MDKTLMECLRWERDHGYRSEADYTRLLEDEATAGHVVTLQEGAPTSYGKGVEAPQSPAAALDETIHHRLAAAILGAPQFMTLQEEAAAYRAAPPKPKKNARTLSESRDPGVSERTFQEARERMFAAVRGEAVIALPSGVHRRLAMAHGHRGY